MYMPWRFQPICCCQCLLQPGGAEDLFCLPLSPKVGLDGCMNNLDKLHYIHQFIINMVCKACASSSWKWKFIVHINYTTIHLEKWWDGLPPNNMAQVLFPDSASYSMRVEFVGSLLYSLGLFSGYSGSPLSSKTYIWFELISIYIVLKLAL